jgi:hypothetical protein
LNVVLPLRVVVPPRMQWLSDPGSPGGFSFLAVSGQRYVVERTDALGNPWTPIATNVPSEGGSLMILTNAPREGAGFFRVRVE